MGKFGRSKAANRYIALFATGLLARFRKRRAGRTDEAIGQLENYLLQDLGLHRGEIRYLRGDLNYLVHRHE